MTRKLLIILLLCLPTACISGQTANSGLCDSLYQKLTEPGLIGEIFINNFQSRGSQYFIDDWLKGTIYVTDNRSIQDNYLRYNGYIDQLIRVTRNFLQVRLDKGSVTGFTLYDKVPGRFYTFHKISIKEELLPEPVEVYAQLLYQGNLSLYAYRKVRRTGIDQDPGNRFMIYKFENFTSYHFISAGSPSTGFRKINRRNVLKYFPDKKEQLLNLLRAQKIHRIKTENDLISIAGLLNGMK